MQKLLLLKPCLLCCLQHTTSRVPVVPGCCGWHCAGHIPAGQHIQAGCIKQLLQAKADAQELCADSACWNQLLMDDTQVHRYMHDLHALLSRLSAWQ